MVPLLMLVLAQTPCEPPRTHPIEPLMLAAHSDGERVLAVERALNCREGGSTCATEIKQCTTALAEASVAADAFDETPYLLDLDTPYVGETFTQSRLWVKAASLKVRKCPRS